MSRGARAPYLLVSYGTFHHSMYRANRVALSPYCPVAKTFGMMMSRIQEGGNDGSCAAGRQRSNIKRGHLANHNPGGRSNSAGRQSLEAHVRTIQYKQQIT